MPGGLATGQLLDERYALEEPLGEDALGTTWRAYDRGLGRTVCLRDVRYPDDDLFADDGARLKQALMAARLAIRLDHPGAVHVYDAFLDGDRLMVVTEWTAARSLASLVSRKGPLAPRRVAALALDLLDPLAATHARGLVHGWLTPDNVLVADRGPARLAGLGMAPPFTEDSSRAWMDAMATSACLAPEQVKLQGATGASDLWALGATLYYAVEGAHAFESRQDVSDRHPRPSTNAKGLGEILERLLSKEPAWRPSVDDLRPQLAEVAGVALPSPAEEAAEPSQEVGRRRNRRDRRRDEPGEPEAAAALPGGAGPVAEPGTGTEAVPDWDAAVIEPPVADLPAEPEDTVWGDWSSDSTSEASDVWFPDAGYGDEPAAAPSDPWARDTYRSASTWRGLDESPDTEVEAGREPFGAEGGGVAADVILDDDDDDDEADEGGAGDDDGHRFRSSPSWPPQVRRRSVGIIFLCSLVMVVMVVLLVTNGRLGRPSTPSSLRVEDRPVLATDNSLVPREWIAYRHPNVNFTVSYPRQWTLREEEGSLITIREPSTGTELRVDYRDGGRTDPVRTWEAQERDLAARHPNDYKRLQLSPASYLGHVAGLWEYTYLDGNLPVHAVDLGFLTDDHTFTMSFRAPASTWDTMLGMFQGFLSSVRAPE